MTAENVGALAKLVALIRDHLANEVEGHPPTRWGCNACPDGVSAHPGLPHPTPADSSICWACGLVVDHATGHDCAMGGDA